MELADWLKGTHGAGLSFGRGLRDNPGVGFPQGNDLLAVLEELFAMVATQEGMD
jgi:hypothetical protein